MRLQSFSVTHFLRSMQEVNANLATESQLVGRLKNVLLKLEYYDLTSATLLNQQENLLSLVSTIAKLTHDPEDADSKISDVQYRDCSTDSSSEQCYFTRIILSSSHICCCMYL